ncbi:uncharacterized protein PV07_08009 [Cladophialophora immunda]|uniref:Transcription factor domain-containing protein n=1 Tax=Cladophialophora immunda TaxID=569365 RepID=A0A0D1ZK09_9EURO|nr:uncharacterized protein PV07_08009 [Cladophialophora immunda]KIW28336.1 hypothetical protein PV07_08009 [Cladophialophora immunda]
MPETLFTDIGELDFMFPERQIELDESMQWIESSAQMLPDILTPFPTGGYNSPPSDLDQRSLDMTAVVSTAVGQKSHVEPSNVATIEADGSPGFCQESERAVSDFIQLLYVVFPVIDRDSVYRQLAAGDGEADPQFRALLLAIRMMNQARQWRMTAAKDAETPLVELIRQVEVERTRTDFAESPSLDTVVTSLFLFCGYSVLDRHNRSFLYLEEAINILEMISISETNLVPIRNPRYARIQMVLFNTESATYSIYGRSRRRSRRAFDPLQIYSLLQTSIDGDELEQRAYALLRRLTRIHFMSLPGSSRYLLAQLGLQLARDEFGMTSQDWACLLQGASDTSHDEQLLAGWRKQTADVLISYQWRWLEFMARHVCPDGRQTAPSAFSDSEPDFLRSFYDGALTVLSCTSALKNGELRSIGLGKLVDMTLIVHRLVGSQHLERGLDKYRHVLVGLISTITTWDFEKEFSLVLADCINEVTGLSAPRQSPWRFASAEVDTEGIGRSNLGVNGLQPTDLEGFHFSRRMDG